MGASQHEEGPVGCYGQGCVCLEDLDFSCCIAVVFLEIQVKRGRASSELGTPEFARGD